METDLCSWGLKLWLRNKEAPASFRLLKVRRMIGRSEASKLGFLAYQHLLVAILSHVEQRKISNDYTIQFRGHRYQLTPRQLRIG